MKRLGAAALVALALATPAQPAPLHTISRYVANPDPARWYDLGCALGQAVAAGTRPKDALVILAMGDPAVSAGTYGAHIFDGSFRTTAQLRAIAQQYGYGYWVCSPYDSTLRIVLGTTNHGAAVSYAHGAAWARMVNATNDYFAANCCIDAQVVALGGIDAELDWNPPGVTLPWANGYDSANAWSYVEFGDAAGCPPAGTCDGGWTYPDLWSISWAIPPALPLPQIYNEHGTQAAQWDKLDLWGVATRSIAIGFRGTLAQHQACLDRADPCTGTDNTADEAWTQLRDALASSTSTALVPRWSTDMSWRN
jgi:hypothetical protein